MAEGFKVDLEALQRAAAGINGTLDEVSRHKVSGIPHDEATFGHARLAATFADFCGRWERGVDNLAKDGREIAARLTVNVVLYRQAEKNIQNHLVHGILASPGTDPGKR